MKVNDYLVARGLKRRLIEISSGKGIKNLGKRNREIKEESYILLL